MRLTATRPSLLDELAAGPAEALRSSLAGLGFEDAIAFAGVSKFPARVKCALLGWSALRDATLQATAQPSEATPAG